jgi:hypothetical protein
MHHDAIARESKNMPARKAILQAATMQFMQQGRRFATAGRRVPPFGISEI